jgi:elongation factor G
VRVTLFDGKAHSVDSSDMAFQTAGALALKAAATEQTVSLLEPVDRVRVEVADEYLGAVLGDLQTRRVRVNGTESAGDGRTAILADVPQSEMIRYAVDLRSVSHGTGMFSREPGGYEAIPAHLVKGYLSS